MLASLPIMKRRVSFSWPVSPTVLKKGSNPFFILFFLSEKGIIFFEL